jgi:hypothetical protein
LPAIERNGFLPTVNRRVVGSSPTGRAIHSSTFGIPSFNWNVLNRRNIRGSETLSQVCLRQCSPNAQVVLAGKSSMQGLKRRRTLRSRSQRSGGLRGRAKCALLRAPQVGQGFIQRRQTDGHQVVGHRNSLFIGTESEDFSGSRSSISEQMVGSTRCVPELD